MLVVCVCSTAKCCAGGLTCALVCLLLPQELGMLEYELLTFRPSHVASAAVLLAKLYTNETQGIK